MLFPPIFTVRRTYVTRPNAGGRRPAALAALAASLVVAQPLAAQSPPPPRPPLAPAAALIASEALERAASLRNGAAELLQSRLAPIRSGAISPEGQWAGLWAGGRNFKVSFHDGMTFYPHVGAELPHQPFGWRTSSVRAGGSELLAGESQQRPPEPPRVPLQNDYRCEYDLGGGVVECYDVTALGVAQSFLFVERPPAGDLVIEGLVATPLFGPADRLVGDAEQHGTLSFALADGREVIRYGAAVAVDAAGRRTPMTSCWDGERISLMLPAAAVAAAEFPLLVDPLLSNALLEQAGELVDVDVLHESVTPAATPARTWVVFSRMVAADDADLWMWRYDSDVRGPAIDAFHELSAWDARGGQLALAPGVGRVVLVFENDAAGTKHIGVRSHDTGDLGLRTSYQFPLSTNGAHDWRPDVGGRMGAVGDTVLIAWQREFASSFANTSTSTVHSAVFDATFGAPNPVVVAPFVVRSVANADQERPVVNQSAEQDEWLVAFQEHNGNVSNDDWDVLAVGVDGVGSVSASLVDTAQAGQLLRHKIAPQLAGASGRYVLSYQVRQFELLAPKPTGRRGQSVFAQRVDWDHGVSNSGVRVHAPVELVTASGSSADVRGEGIAFDPTSASHWAMAVSDRGQDEFRLLKLGYTGQATESITFGLAAGSRPVDMAPAFDFSLRRFPLVFAVNTPSDEGLLLSNVLVYETAAQPMLRHVACGSGVWGGLAATASRQSIGSEAMPLRLVNAPFDSVALLLLSTAEFSPAVAVPGAPGCGLVVDLFGPGFLGSIALPIVGGAAEFALDLPEALPSGELFAQWSYLVPNVNALGLQASEGLRLELRR